MASIQFTDDDRDARGFVTPTAPVRPPPREARTLADLLPTAPAPTRAPLSRQEIISAAIFVPILLGALLYLSSGRTPAPIASVPTPAAAPTSAPAPSPQPPAPAMLPAYAAPDGTQLGSIEATRAITPTAHYGADWIQADVIGSGRIWLRAADFPALAIVGADLAPRPTAPPVAAPAPVLAAEPPQEAPPAPRQCAQAGIPGKMTEVCGSSALTTLEAEAKAAWLAQYGGNAGVLDAPTPQPLDRRAILNSEETRP